MTKNPPPRLQTSKSYSIIMWKRQHHRPNIVVRMISLCLMMVVLHLCEGKKLRNNEFFRGTYDIYLRDSVDSSSLYNQPFCRRTRSKNHWFTAKNSNLSQKAMTESECKQQYMCNSSVVLLRGGGLLRRRTQNVLIVKKSSKESSVIPHEESPEHKRLMILIKVLFLSYYGSLGSLMPYLPVYYHALGHGGLIIGLIGAVKPLTTFLVAPFWGILSDRSGDKFRILKLTFMVSLIGQLLVSYSSEVHFLVGMTLITAIMNAPVKTLIDSMVMDNLSAKDRSQYGRLRLWGQLGFGLGSSGVGVLLSRSQAGHYSNGEQPSMTPIVEGATMIQTLSRVLYNILIKFWNELTGYKLLFSTYAALSIPTWLCLKKFERLEHEKRQLLLRGKSNGRGKKKQSVEKKKQQQGGAHILEGLNLLIHNRDALFFFFLVFIVGTSSGCIENFAYVRMREVGGSGKEMGLSRLVSSAAGAPMFWFSGPLTERLGADRVLVLSLLSYVVRFFIYAFMRNPYHGLPAEAMRGLTFAAFWSTGTIYAHRISPPGMSATMLMFLNAMYGGLGQSMGAIIGGKLQSKFGTVRTFLYSGIFDLCFVGLVVMYLNVRKESSFRDPKPMMPSDMKTLQGNSTKKK